MKTLDDSDVIAVMREVWDERVATLFEQIDMKVDAKVGGENKPIISPDLKVKHKNSGIKYTVSSVGPRDVILKTPEGEEFLVDAEDLESDYQLE